MMNQVLLQKFKELEKSRQQLLNELSKKTNEELNYKVNSTSWSIIQVTYHLLQAERLAVTYMSKKILGINTSPSTNILTSIKFFLLTLALKSPLRFKAPSIIANAPANESIGSIMNQWNEVRKSLENILANFPTEHENKEVFKNVIIGKVNIHQALAWMNDHFQHHLLQIERIYSSYNKK